MVTSGNLDAMGSWNGLDLDDLELRSGTMLLRPWRPADAAAVHRIMADPAMTEYLPLPRPYSEADARSFVTDFAAAGRRDGTRLECALEVSGELVGAASLRLPVNGVAPEIGYWIASRHWGRGHATTATRALADWGFAHAIRRIRILADVANVSSAGVALNAGFSYEGVERRSQPSQHGLADHAVFARLDIDSGLAIPPGFPRLDELSDGVVALRPVRAEDWPVLYAEFTNEESRRWGFGTPFTEDDARERAASAGLAWLVGRKAELIILDAPSGQGAGTIALMGGGPPGVSMIGYGVLPEFRGRRFTTRALRLLTRWVFEQTGIARLELGCKVDNVASARSAEGAGFSPDGRYPERLRNPDGSYSDELRFSLLRRDFAPT